MSSIAAVLPDFPPWPASISHFRSSKLLSVFRSLSFAQYLAGSSNKTLESESEVVIKM